VKETKEYVRIFGSRILPRLQNKGRFHEQELGTPGEFHQPTAYNVRW